VRRAAQVATTLAAVAALALPAAAQDLAIGAGAAVASRLLVDGNGTTVRLRPAPYVAIDAARPLRADGAALLATARVAYATARASAGGRSWSAGGVLQADLTAGVRGRARRGIVAHAALGATALAGPRDVRPFRGTLLSPLAEIGAAARLRGAVRADVRVQAFRVAPAGGTAGGVVRMIVGVAHAR
jgi:hypothetical protein